MCQAVIRRRMSINKTEKLKHKLHTFCATLIQAKWRSYSARESLIYTVVQIMMVQSMARRWLAIRQAKKLKHELRECQVMSSMRRLAQADSTAATKIASTWKPHFHQRRFAEKRASVVVIQARWRGFIAFEKYIQTIFYLLTIQAFARRLIACARVKKLRQGRQLLCTVIKMQSLVRRNVAVKKYVAKVKWLNRLRESACICIQAVYRGHVVRGHVSNQVAAASEIQSAFRGFVGRLRYVVIVSSIIICQSVCRRKLVQRDRERRQHAAVLIQSSFRCHSVRMTYVITVSNIILCQSAWRKRVANKRVQKMISDQQDIAATKLAAAFRGYVQRMDYIINVNCLITCQSIVRRKLACMEADTLKMIQCKVQQSAATTIQRFSRGYFGRMNYIVMLVKIIISQSVVRRWLEAKKTDHLRNAKRTAAATVIQKRYRGYIAFTKYIDTVVNVIICQAVARKHIASRQAQAIRHERDEASRNLSATKIAAACRGHIAYSSYNTALTDIIICQAYARRWMATRDVFARKKSWQGAAVAIQSAFRGYIQSIQFILTLSRIIMLQSQVRGFLTRKAFKDEIARRDAAATTIQKNWRSFKVETDFM